MCLKCRILLFYGFFSWCSQTSLDNCLMCMASGNVDREGEKAMWAVTIARGVFLGKSVGSCYGSTAMGSTSALSLDERKVATWAYSGIFWFTYQLRPMGEWNSCLAISVTGRRHFLPNYSSCIMDNCTESPSAAWPVCWAHSVLFECHINKEMGHFLFPLTLCHFK